MLLLISNSRFSLNCSAGEKVWKSSKENCSSFPVQLAASDRRRSHKSITISGQTFDGQPEIHMLAAAIRKVSERYRKSIPRSPAFPRTPDWPGPI